MQTKENIAQLENLLFQKIYDDFTAHYKGRVVLSHFSSFSQDFVNSLAEGLEVIMVNNKASKLIVKRVFSIMIEQLQNIRIHGVKNKIEKQIGHVIIIENEGNYSISFGNLILPNSKTILREYIEKLNELDEAEIKSFYLENLQNNSIQGLNGAGLGFITIRMKSKSIISTRFMEYDEELEYFEMSLDIQ